MNRPLCRPPTWVPPVRVVAGLGFACTEGGPKGPRGSGPPAAPSLDLPATSQVGARLTAAVKSVFPQS